MMKTWEDFVEKYNPVKNDIVEGASFDGFMFETYGKELERLKELADTSKINDKNGYHVWTIIDGDGTDCILLNGWHAVNRLGYIYTENPWKEGEEIEIVI